MFKRDSCNISLAICQQTSVALHLGVLMVMFWKVRNLGRNQILMVGGELQFIHAGNVSMSFVRSHEENNYFMVWEILSLQHL